MHRRYVSSIFDVSERVGPASFEDDDDDEDLILNDSNFLKAPFVSIEVLMILEVEDGGEGSVILNLL